MTPSVFTARRLTHPGQLGLGRDVPERAPLPAGHDLTEDALRVRATVVVEMPVADAVRAGGVGDGHLAVRSNLEYGVGRQLALVHQQQVAVSVVLDDVHVAPDRLEHLRRLGVAPEAPKRHVEPMRRRYAPIVVARI